MDLAELIKDTKWWCGINEEDTDTYTNEAIIRNYNFNLDLVIMKAMRVSGTWQFDDNTYDTISIAYNDLIANQDNYTLGTDMLRIERLRVKDKNGQWQTLRPRDRAQISDVDLDSYGGSKYYDKLGSSLLLSPIPDYSSDSGIEIQFSRGGNYVTVDDMDRVLGIATTSLRWLALMAALDYTEINEMESRSAKIRNRMQELEAETLSLYSDRDRDGAPYISVRNDSDYRDNLFQQG